MKTVWLRTHILLVCFLIIFPFKYGHSESKQALKLLIIGDSLSAGYGIDINKGWVNLLRKRLKNNQYDIEVINASISGDTSQSAKNRLADYLAVENIDYLIIEIGGNDGLRGLSLKSLKQNIQQMIDLARTNNIKTLLLGIKIPPNYGPFYNQGFEAVFQQLSHTNQIALVPFFLQGIAEDQNKMQADGIHPKEIYQGQILDNVWPELQTLLSQ